MSGVRRSFVASADECNDANASVYAGAPELDDGVDNQCPGGSGSGIVDEIADTLHVDSGGVACWIDSSGAATYDVARSSSPDLSPCVIVGSATSASPCVTDSTVPPAGSAFYYVVRAASPNVGSWGTRSSGVERLLSCP
jgi:hypothetical protein